MGAGDTFIAGVLFGLACLPDQWDDAEALRFAADLATLKVQREGFRGLAGEMVDKGIQ